MSIQVGFWIYLATLVVNEGCTPYMGSIQIFMDNINFLLGILKIKGVAWSTGICHCADKSKKTDHTHKGGVWGKSMPPIYADFKVVTLGDVHILSIIIMQYVRFTGMDLIFSNRAWEPKVFYVDRWFGRVNNKLSTVPSHPLIQRNIFFFLANVRGKGLFLKKLFDVLLFDRFPLFFGVWCMKGMMVL